MAESKRFITVALNTEMQAKLLRWCADHCNETLKKGERLSPAWVIRKILERYFQSQETMRKVLTREDPALRGDVE